MEGPQTKGYQAYRMIWSVHVEPMRKRIAYWSVLWQWDSPSNDNMDLPSRAGAEVDEPSVVDSDDESFIGAQGDVLETYMAKRGGRKDVNPHMLRAHACSYNRLAEGNGADAGYDQVSPSSFCPIGLSLTLCLFRSAWSRNR